MEIEKGLGGFSVFKWNIENFSSWNREIHGNVIPSPKSCNFEELSLELYPRGSSGNDEHLVVHIDGDGWIDALSGELSYIGPDGSLLCTQQVDSKEMNVIKFPPGPKFETVVAQIKKNKAIYEDILTVRYLMRYDKEYTEYMNTVISVYDVSFKMSRETIDNLHSEMGTHFFIYYPQGNEKDRKGMQLFASKDSSKIIMKLLPIAFEKNVLVLTRMSVLNNEDELVKTEEDEHLFLDCSGWPFSITLAKEEMKDLKECQTSLILSLKIIPSIDCRHSLSLLHIPKSKVDILTPNSFMPLSTSISAKKSLKSVTSKQKDDPVTILTKDFMCLYQDQDFSDFQLKCGDVSIPVHKNILSARSPVFKTMLSTEMKEATSGCMDIVDLDPSVLCQFLAFLYTGVVEDLEWEIALKLYYAADKYQVPSLKTVCADFLSANVSFSNVCDILSLANKHQDDHLIAVVHEFILNNYNEVLSSEEWKSFMRSEPLLAVETVTHFAEKRYVRKSDAS